MTGREDGREGVREEFPSAWFHIEELHPGAWSFVASILLFLTGVVSGILATEFLLEPVSANIPGSDNWQLMLAAMLVGWLIVMPLTQYLLLRFVGGARPKLAWSALVPNVFTPFRAVGYRFDRRTFALVCAVPFFVGWVLFPSLATFIPGGWETAAPLVGAAMGVSVYFLRYSASALSKPEGTLVEELAEEGSVRFHEPVRRECQRRNV